ncbi:SHOCT domain-containing protein [Kitasatospora sp. NPDC048545]|uniref:SHOCT domain-containing protein n=1 Tax=Kitasatospora sp. NPDC048545 TaxID=3157208 RepID=UPI0033E24658
MPGLLRGVARTAVVAGTATAVSNRVSRRQAGRWAQQDVAAEPAPPPPPPAPAPAAPAPASMDDKISQLQQLAQLRDQGVLTNEEFAAQKQRLLAG